VVKGLRSKRERLRRRLDQLDPLAEATAGDRQHLGAQIHSGHLKSPPQQRRRDQPRPGGHVEHVTAARQARDQEATPARVLSQRQRGADAVIRRPQRGEQLAGSPLQAPRRHPSNHPFPVVESTASQQACDLGGSGHCRLLGSAGATTNGEPAAVATAQAAAGGKDVGIFGASLSRQCLQAGLLDEIVIHLAPVLLGDGIRLFGGEGDRRVNLERISLGEADQLTDLRLRVVK
jgi:RibD C-terminal domain